MAGFRFFKPPQHQQFEYKARYYDPEKEELRERVRRAQQGADYSAEDAKQRIVGSFRRKTSGLNATKGYRSQQVRSSNRRLLIIVALLIAIGYLLFQEYGPMIERLMN